MREVWGAKFQAAPVLDAKSVKSVVEKFREKYGAREREEVLFEIRCGGWG